MPTILDHYPEEHYTSGFSLNDVHPATVAGRYSAGAQSFTTPATPNYKLYSTKFYCYKVGSSGLVRAELYAHAGTYGSSSVPTGSPLAVSETKDGSQFAETPTLYEFLFTGDNQIELDPSTHYVIALIAYTAPFDLANNVKVGRDTSGEHAGNASYYYSVTSSWLSSATQDLIFYVYGTEIVLGGEFGLGKTALVMTL